MGTFVRVAAGGQKGAGLEEVQATGRFRPRSWRVLVDDTSWFKNASTLGGQLVC